MMLNSLGLWLMASIVPVTLFAITGIAVYLLVRRGSPAGGGFASFTALLMLIGVSLLTASSWPHWWTMSFPFSVSVLPPTSSIPVDVNPDIPLAFNPHPKVAIDQRVVGDMPLTDVSNGITESSQVPVTRPVPRHDGQIESKATWGWPEIVGITFLAGLTVAFVRFLLGLWIVRCYRVNSIAITDQEILELVRQNVFDLGLHRAVEVRQAHQLGSPATVGWRRPLILLPDDWKTWNQEERRVVLAHEMAHISRGDYLTWLFAQISLAFHFYHPLVHWLVRRLRFEQELAADVLGAELAGGRELYLVTLASMVLREDSPRSSWAVQSFFPNRGTFLKRIVTLSENTSLRHAAWSRGSTATLVMTMVFLGLFAAGFRVSFAEVVKAPEERPAPTVSDRKVEGQLSTEQPAVEPTKRLTLDELRPLVIDQFRSIRSLYVAYTRIDPARFGGDAHDHVWAEQGFKMLRYDIPSKSTVGYASTFDGKQTYIGTLQGDLPVRGDIRNELIPRFHLTLQSTLLGVLHFMGSRESIVDVIRAPTAILVETQAGDVGPRIEVKNYEQPGTKSVLDVIIVLDQSHDYWPKSISVVNVANRSWEFVYEVDEFQKVRDGATGEDRWFPLKGRYKQRTPEHGDDVFTTKITKLQINDLLQDDLFVLASDSPSPAPGQEQQAIADFEKAYRLEAGQLIKQIKKPFLPGRMANLKKWWASAFAQSPYETTGTFLPMVYPEREGKLGQPGFNFTSAPGVKGIPASRLLNAVGAGLDLRFREVEDSDNLLSPEIEGDYVIRADAPADKVISALGKLLREECGVQVDLELRELVHDVVMISGKISPPFILEPKTVIELSATLQSDDDGIEIGTFDKFMKAVGQSIEPNRRVLSQIENFPYRNEKISWHRNAVVQDGDQALQGADKTRAVLDHLEKQTGLKFTLENRKFPTVFVRRSE